MGLVHVIDDGVGVCEPKNIKVAQYLGEFKGRYALFQGNCLAVHNMELSLLSAAW